MCRSLAELLNELTGELLRFEAEFLDARGWPAEASLARGAEARGRAVAVLVEYLPGVLAVPELVELVDVALGWERRLREAPKWTPGPVQVR